MEERVDAVGVLLEGVPLQRVLVAVDGSKLSDRLVGLAASIWQPLGARVTVVQVIADEDGELARRSDVLALEIGRTAAWRNLAQVALRLRDRGLLATSLLAEGRPAEQVARLVEERGIDLLALASHGSGGLAGWNLGGTAQKLIHCAGTSLLMLPSHLGSVDEGLRQIFVPMDGSKRSECVLPLAERLAAHHGARLVLFHAVLIPETPRRAMPSREDEELVVRLTEHNRRDAISYLGELAHRLRADGLHVRIRVDTTRRLFRAIEAAATEEGADLILLCAHGATADRSERHGGLPDRFLRSATVPTLVLQDMPPLRHASKTPGDLRFSRERATSHGSTPPFLAP